MTQMDVGGVNFEIECSGTPPNDLVTILEDALRACVWFWGRSLELTVNIQLCATEDEFKAGAGKDYYDPQAAMAVTRSGKLVVRLPDGKFEQPLEDPKNFGANVRRGMFFVCWVQFVGDALREDSDPEAVWGPPWLSEGCAGIVSNEVFLRSRGACQELAAQGKVSSSDLPWRFSMDLLRVDGQLSKDRLRYLYSLWTGILLWVSDGDRISIRELVLEFAEEPTADALMKAFERRFGEGLQEALERFLVPAWNV